MRPVPGSSLPRRFHREARARALPDAGGVAVLLDERILKTPAGRDLVVPTPALADAIAAEWNALGERIDPVRLPLTALANTAIDVAGPRRAEILATLRGFAETDMLCYRAESPDELVRRQRELWDPPLAALAECSGARLLVHAGLLPRPQPPEALERIAATLETLDDWRLAVVQAVAGATHSLALALVHAFGAIARDDLVAAAHLDETFQNERWGIDEQARRRRRAIEEELHAADRFLSLLGTGGAEGSGRKKR